MQRTSLITPENDTKYQFFFRHELLGKFNVLKPDEYYMHVMDCIVFQQTVLAVNVSLMFAKG